MQYNKRTTRQRQIPRVWFSTTCEAIPTFKVSVALHVTSQWEWKPAWNPAQFEHDLSNSLIKISLVFHITPRKCQLGKPLINDKQHCNYAWYSARLRSLRCWGVDPILLQAHLSNRAARRGPLPARSLWIEIKWLSTGQWQPSELLHWETRALSQRVHAFPASTRVLSAHTAAMSHHFLPWIWW